MLRPAVRRRRRRWTCLRRTWTGRPATLRQRVRLRSCRQAESEGSNGRRLVEGSAGRGGQQARSRRRHPLDRRSAPAPRLLRPHFRGPADLLQFEGHGPAHLGRAARPRGAAHQCLASFGRRGRGGVLLQLAHVQARPSRSWGAAAWSLRTSPPAPSPTTLSETLVSTSAIWCAENKFSPLGK